jgi:hypothetical protein
MKAISDLIENSGGRRFLITVGAGTFTTLLQWFEKLDKNGTTFAMVIIATVGAYITNNTYQKVKASSKEEADK